MKKLNCKKIEDMLPSYLEGELSEWEAGEIEKHLHTCAKCRASLQEWKRCLSLLGNAPRLEAPAHIWEKIRANLPAERRQASFPLRWALVSSLLLILVVGGLTIFHTLSQPRPASVVIAQQPTVQPLPPQPQQPSVSVSKVAKPLPQPRKSTPPLGLKPKASPSTYPTKPTVAKAVQPLPSPSLEEGSVEDKVAERLQLALTSAQSAEESLERAFKSLQGEKEF